MTQRKRKKELKKIYIYKQTTQMIITWYLEYSAKKRTQINYQTQNKTNSETAVNQAMIQGKQLARNQQSEVEFVITF